MRRLLLLLPLTLLTACGSETPVATDPPTPDGPVSGTVTITRMLLCAPAPTQPGQKPNTCPEPEPLQVDCEQDQAFCADLALLNRKWKEEVQAVTEIGCDGIYARGTLDGEDVWLQADCNVGKLPVAQDFLDLVREGQPEWASKWAPATAQFL